MTKPDPAIAINLSYVLHERSDSAVVARYAADIERHRRKRERLVSRLEDLPDGMLRQRIVVDGHLPRPDQSELRILSVKLGAWRLLEPLLSAVAPWIERKNVFTTFVDGDDEKPEVCGLFRGSARLCVFPESDVVVAATYFAAAIFRPGDNTIQLRLESIDADTVLEVEDHMVWERTRLLIERTIREFVLQWDCDRSLWNLPVEETLPEFGSGVQGGEDA